MALRLCRPCCYDLTDSRHTMLAIRNMIDGPRFALKIATYGAALLVLSGCASMRKQKIVPESIATCREISRDGVAAMELEQWEKARTLLVKAVAISPTDIDARRHLGETLWNLGNRRDAVVNLEAAVHLDPRHAPTIIRSGEMLLGIGAIDTALERAEQAIALDRTLAEAWALRGRVYREQGKIQKALADLQRALRYSPHATDVLLDVAEIQYHQGRPQRSLVTLHCLLDIYPPSEEPQQALWLEGMVYSALGRPRDAVESLYAASLKGQPPAELLFQLAQAENHEGNPTAASNTLRRALELDSGHKASLLMLAQLQESSVPGQSDVIRR